MKTYKSHKTVKALKIGRMEGPLEGGEFLLFCADEPNCYQLVDRAFMEKHLPHAGGYFVEYGDGYQSFSPARAFEEGYSEVVA